MKSAHLLIPAALAAGLLAACQNARPVSAPYEEPRAFAFPHDKHGGFDCVDCHTGIPKASRLGEAKLPGQVKCEECHDVKNPSDDQTRNVVKALSSLSKRPAGREYQITFNHADHLNRIKAKEPNQVCATCHKALPEATGTALDVTPPMNACTACHYHSEEVAQAKCQPCHVSLRRYPLKPIETLAGFSHTANWVHEHGRIAKNSATTCAACHDQTYCANCHATSTVPFRPEIRFPEKVEAGFIHRADYVSRHQIEVQADPAMCRRCHGSFFCDSCHTAQNVSPRVRLGTGQNPNNPHPPNWANNVGAGPQLFHGDAARANIVNCAGCHDQGARAICTQCHRSNGPGSAGIGGDPHPADFRAKHKRDEIRTTAMCRACHLNG
jgi:hypothetical protein